jgi:phage gp46-like protein
MRDITITWDPVNNRGDWSVVNGGLAIGNDLETAVLVSLFTWRGLPADTAPPDGTTDRRGWWADTFNDVPIGSRLWTLYRAVKSDASALLQQAQDICIEALQWMIDDSIAASVDVVTFWAGPVQLGILITIAEPDGTVSKFKYSWAWKAIS